MTATRTGKVKYGAESIIPISAKLWRCAPTADKLASEAPILILRRKYEV